MSITIHMHIQVKDFDDWKAVFDGAEIARVEAGIEATPYKELDDPNHVHVIATAPSKEAFLAFLFEPRIAKENPRVYGRRGPSRDHIFGRSLVQRLRNRMAGQKNAPMALRHSRHTILRR